MEEKNILTYLKIKKDGILYECLGVFLYENYKKIKIAFNACNDKVIDSIFFEKKDVIENRKVDENKVKIFKI